MHFGRRTARLSARFGAVAIIGSLALVVVAPSASAATGYSATITPSSAVAGSTGSYAVKVTNNNLSVINTVTVTIPSSFGASSHTASASNLAVFPGQSTTVTVNSVTAPTTTGTYNWTVDASAVIGGDFGTTNLPVTVTPATPTKLAFAQQPTETDVNHAVSPPVTVQVLDQYGNVATGYTTPVTLSINTGPSGANPPTGNVATPSNGLATFSSLQLTTQGTYTLTASSGTLSPATSNQFPVDASIVPCPANQPCTSGNISGTDNEGSKSTPVTTTVDTNANSGSQNDTLITTVGVAGKMSCATFGETASISIATRSKTITYTLATSNTEASTADENSGADVSELNDICYGSTTDFKTKSGALAGAGTTQPFEGLLPTCAKTNPAPPCIQSRTAAANGAKDSVTWTILAAAGDPNLTGH
jgi:hypothetical protein